MWIHRITKGKESNKCDLCRALRMKESRFTTEADLPEQDLGHIQHTCEALSEVRPTQQPTRREVLEADSWRTSETGLC